MERRINGKAVGNTRGSAGLRQAAHGCEIDRFWHQMLDDDCQPPTGGIRQEDPGSKAQAKGDWTEESTAGTELGVSTKGVSIIEERAPGE